MSRRTDEFSDRSVPDRGVEAPGTFHHIWLWEAEGLVLTDINNPEVVHRHAAVQVVVSLTTPTAMRLEGGDWCVAQGTVVAGDVPHAYDSREQPAVGLWIDPTSTIARRLVVRYLHGAPIVPLDEGLCSEVAEVVGPPADRHLAAGNARRLFRRIMTVLLGEPSEPTPMDPRVKAVLHRLEGETSLPPVAELAGAVGLSASRLQHLVRTEVGIPLSRWVLWRRTLRGLAHMLDGASPTEAAFAAGFADGPDFTRRFHEFLGAPPAAALEDPRASVVVASRLPVRAA